ncbi:MAG TPA: threonine/serine exporter family protein [Candidatus Tetragenococcus pullicola]|nr:threonine/serine exporter family protein [Candidatus Tetragenococcus pullicola]
MDNSKELIVDTCLLAGRIMMESGSEVYRVEDTMSRIAASAGEPDSISYVTVTGLFMGLRNGHHTQVENVGERTINLEKVSSVNQLSRQFAEKKIELNELYGSLEKIDRETPFFPLWMQIISAGLVSSFMMYLFVETWSDFLITFLVGIIGFSVKYNIKKQLDVKYVDVFFAAFFIGICASLTVHLGWGQNVDSIIIGAIMPHVPGVAITTSFRDILAGHLLSGIARGTEAIIIALAIGIGIVVSLSMMGGGIL